MLGLGLWPLARRAPTRAERRRAGAGRRAGRASQRRALTDGTSCCSDPAPRSLPPAAAAAGAVPAGAAAPDRAAVRSGRRVAVRRGVRRRGRGRGRRVRAAAVRPAAAPPGAAGAGPAAAHVQPRRRHVRGRRRLPGLHRLPGAVLPVLPDRRAALHPAAPPHHHDPERVRGRRQVRGPGADAAAARAARRAALARAPRRAAAAPSAMALGAAARECPRPPSRTDTRPDTEINITFCYKSKLNIKLLN